MAARYCAYCGQPVYPGFAFCPVCGAAAPGGLAPGAPPGAPLPPPPPGWSPYPTYPAYPVQRVGPGGGPPAFGAADRTALSDVNLAAIIALAGIILSLVNLFNSSALSLYSTTTVGTVTSISGNQTAFYWVAVLGATGLVLTLVELWLFRRAFRTLSPHDASFLTPGTLTLVAMVGLTILVLVVLGLLAVVYQAIQCAGPGNAVTTRCLDLGTLLGLFAILLIAAIVVLVGYIGFLIGIWRLGTRYGEDMFKAGAILLIIPVLNVVGVVLILLATRSARRKVQGASPSVPFG